jgi:phosphoribosyl-AMP cyclohydrolase
VDAVIFQARRILARRKDEFTNTNRPEVIEKGTPCVAFAGIGKHSNLGRERDESSAMGLLQWDFFEYLPVVLQDAATRDVLMVQYMTEDGLRRTLEDRSMWLWSHSREEFWMAGRQSSGYDLQALRANCMGDGLLAIVDATDRAVCHLGHKSCFSQPVPGAHGGE